MSDFFLVKSASLSILPCLFLSPLGLHLLILSFGLSVHLVDIISSLFEVFGQLLRFGNLSLELLEVLFLLCFDLLSSDFSQVSFNLSFDLVLHFFLQSLSF